MDNGVTRIENETTTLKARGLMEAAVTAGIGNDLHPKTGENDASLAFSVVPPPDPSTRSVSAGAGHGGIPFIEGMNVYEECYDEPQTGSRAPHIEHVIAEAIRQKYRITACVCGDPRIHSKTTGRSTCLRCQLVEVSEVPLVASTHQKCRRCKKYRWAVLKANYCDYCYERVQAQKEAA
jgi:hypothetical protein